MRTGRRAVVAVVGLGNPGEEYRTTRHNIGFLVAEEFSRAVRAGEKKNRGSYLSTEITAGTMTVVIAWPQLYMNNSGPAVADLIDDYKATIDDILVISDDVALPLGSIRIRPGGSHGGHNGLRSVIETLGSENFARMRCGINSGAYHDADDLADFVLSPFPVGEEETVLAMVRRAAEAIGTYAASGIEAAMTRFNT